ncbi:MAG: M13-type metalloendopeptidase [Actinomycetaceae bacterium]|nr:M13-type metalloendopeptidase [Actinomycetaceae bacterium]
MTIQDFSSPVLDPDAMDKTVSPTDDFYRHANGQWLAQHEIPADRPADGAFYALRDMSEERVREIVTTLSTSSDDPDERKLAGLFDQFMNEDAINAAGIEPLVTDFARIEQASNAHDLALVMAQLQRTGVTGIIETFVDVDMNDPENYTVFLYQGGLGLPDESFYREDQYAPIRDAYVNYLNASARLIAERADVSTPQLMRELGKDYGQRVLDFETKIAEHHWDNVSTRDAVKSNNALQLNQLIDGYPGFPWGEMIDALGIDMVKTQNVNLRQPSYAAGVTELWSDDNFDDLQLWLAARIISARSPYLADEFVDAHFEFSRVLTGATELRPRWKRAVSFLEAAMGEALGRIYVERHFPPDYKNRMEHLVAKLIEAYRQSISSLDWMSDATRDKALMKLSQFTPKIGYPDKWKDYSALEVGADLVDSVRQASIVEYERNVSKLGEPVDRSEWFMTPQTVNAYYNPTMNEIVFPAAILQPPFFNPDAPDAVNYGAIGAVIGHEIGHGFDDQGSQYDGLGRLNNWWSDEDREEFDLRTSKLIEQYSQFSPAELDDDYRVNGALTIGENIGDLGGLTIAWKAYLLALAEKGIDSPADDRADDLSGAEQFFYSWARIWRSKSRNEYAKQLLATDPHSPAEFRCNGVVRNVDVFHETFGTTPQDDMWLAEDQRVSIW